MRRAARRCSIHSKPRMRSRAARGRKALRRFSSRSYRRLITTGERHGRMKPSMRILIVEDEPKVASFIRQGLQEERHSVDVAGDGAEALDLLSTVPAPDLVVLDLLLPKRDGFSVLKTLRERGVATPVLVLTARDTVTDKVAGLDLGADDYLTKPFAFEEFLARVRALLRRGTGQAAPLLRVGDLTLNPATREVARAGRPISLTTREYTLLEYFMRNAGRVLTRPMIAEHIWHLDFDG